MRSQSPASPERPQSGARVGVGCGRAGPGVARAPALEVAYNPNDCPEQRSGSDEASTCTRRAPPDQQQQMASHRAWFSDLAAP